MSSPTAAMVRLAFATLAIGTWGCVGPQAQLTQLLEARRLASELHVEFTRRRRGQPSGHGRHRRSVGRRSRRGETRQAGCGARRRRRCGRSCSRSATRERPAATSRLHARFDEYRRLDDEILPLAVENTNLKAQRLSFGPAREAADAFRASLDGAVRASGARTVLRRGARGASAGGRARDSGAAGAAYRRSGGRGDDAHGGADDRVGGAARKALDELNGDAAGSRRPSSPRRRGAGSLHGRSTRRSSRCRGATATCARWRCRSAASGR